MKNVMLAGVLTAMMLTSAATAAVPCAQGINNANKFIFSLKIPVF